MGSMSSLSAGVAAALAQTPVVSLPAPAMQTGEAVIASILTRGQLLYRFDQAASRSTDALLKDVRDPGAAGIRGWIVEPQERALRVTYFGFSGADAIAIYEASVVEGRVSKRRLIAPADRVPFDARRKRMIAARTAGAERLERCGAQPFNTVVLPPLGADAPIDVYQLTPQIVANAWPLGRHYRLQVAADGNVTGSRAFSKSCLTLSTAGAPKGAKPAALFVTHILDAVPTEMHVFTALTSGIPLIVQTGGETRWLVSGRSIRRIPMDDASQGSRN